MELKKKRSPKKTVLIIAAAVLAIIIVFAAICTYVYFRDVYNPIASQYGVTVKIQDIDIDKNGVSIVSSLIFPDEMSQKDIDEFMLLYNEYRLNKLM